MHKGSPAPVRKYRPPGNAQVPAESGIARPRLGDSIGIPPELERGRFRRDRRDILFQSQPPSADATNPASAPTPIGPVTIRRLGKTRTDLSWWRCTHPACTPKACDHIFGLAASDPEEAPPGWRNIQPDDF